MEKTFASQTDSMGFGERVSLSGKKQVDTVIFDLGNVLVFHDNAQLFRTFGMHAGIPGDDFSRLVPASLWGAIHSGQLDGEGIRREICRVLGVDLSEEQFRRDWNSHFKVNREILPLVESLIGQVKVLLLSNTNAIHMAYLIEELPILQRFDDLVLSHEVKKMKPDPAIFEEALRRAGSVASRTAFFDDVPEFVEAAKKVGLRAYVFRNVEELAAQLEELGLR